MIVCDQASLISSNIVPILINFGMRPSQLEGSDQDSMLYSHVQVDVKHKGTGKIRNGKRGNGKWEMRNGAIIALKTTKS